MRQLLFLFVLAVLCGMAARATRLTGTVRDEKGNVLPYSSILIKGTTRGVTAAGDGRYSIDLSPGEHTIVCQYVGYSRQEKKIVVGATEVVLDFQLSPQ